MREVRVPYLLVTDGKSELHFYRHIYSTCNELGMNIHLAVENAMAGCPEDTLARCQRLRCGKYSGVPRENCAIVTDAEDYEPSRLAKLVEDGEREQIAVFFQRPCFECLLLAHVDGEKHKQNFTCPQCYRCVRHKINDYKKGYEQIKYRTKIGVKQIFAATQLLDDYARFIEFIGLKPLLPDL